MFFFNVLYHLLYDFTNQSFITNNTFFSGTGLAFIVYPEAISQMPAPTVWAILFFFMMLIIGFSSQVRNYIRLTIYLFVKILKQYNRYIINVLKIISLNIY